MTAAIIDDERNNRNLIKDILAKNCPYIDVIVEEEDVENAIASINSKKPDIVFLDIELKNGSGFDVLEKVKFAHKFIFITAYSQYAIKALKQKAYDYILKPINDDELIDTVNRLFSEFEIQKNYSLYSDDESMYTFTTSGGKIFVKLTDIIYFEGSGSYSKISSVYEKDLLISKNIGEIEEEIQNHFFFRTHKSYIINLNHIQSFELNRSGTITLNNNFKIPISQRKKSLFLLRLKQLKLLIKS